MSGTIQIEDVVRYASYVSQCPVELGDLPNTRSALQGPKAVSSTSALQLKLIIDGWGRLAVAWEHADVDCVPFVRHGTIDIYAEHGETLLHAEVKMQPFPPSQFGILFGPSQRTHAIHQRYFRVTVNFTTSASVRSLTDTSEGATVSSKVFTGLSSD